MITKKNFVESLNQVINKNDKVIVIYSGISSFLNKFPYQKNLTSEILTLIDEARADKMIHSKTLEDLSENRLDNWQPIATERKYIDKFNDRIDSLNEELKTVRDKQEVELSNGIIEKRDFYTFISGVTGLEKSFIEFLVSSLPAVFIDIISALCLNLALFIKSE